MFYRVDVGDQTLRKQIEQKAAKKTKVMRRRAAGDCKWRLLKLPWTGSPRVEKRWGATALQDAGATANAPVHA